MREIRPTAVAITPRPRMGQPVRSNELILDFDVEVDETGCYAISVVVYEDDPVYDDVILQNYDAYVPCACLAPGVHKFRVTAAGAAPAGATPPPPATAGTTTLPPIEGNWPTDDGDFDTDIELKYEIAVYRIGDCVAGACTSVPASSLPGKYMELNGPWVNGKLAPIDRTLVPPARTLARAGDGDLRVASASPSRGGDLTLTVADAHVQFEMVRTSGEDTFFTDAVRVRKSVQGKGGGWEPRLEMFVKASHPTLRALGSDLLQVEEAVRKKNMRPAVAPLGRVVRHGRVTVFDAAGAMTAIFVHGNFDGVFSRGATLRVGDLARRLRLAADVPRFATRLGLPLLLADGAAQPAAGAEAPTATRSEPCRESETVWIVYETWVYAIAWIMAGTDYIDSINELISDVIDPVLNRNCCLEELSILSHGSPHTTANGTKTGSSILMGAPGSGDTLDSNHFDSSGNVTNTTTKNLLDKLKAAMCPGARLIFSACGQEVGNLLQNISRYLGNDITVSGYQDLGHPFGSGNTAYQNGSSVPAP